MSHSAIFCYNLRGEVHILILHFTRIKILLHPNLNTTFDGNRKTNNFKTNNILSRSDWLYSQNKKYIGGSFLNIRIFLFMKYVHPNFEFKKGRINRLKPALSLSLSWPQICDGHRFILKCGSFWGPLFWIPSQVWLLPGYLLKAIHAKVTAVLCHPGR